MAAVPFLTALSRPQPTPGGGAAAAYGAQVGLALLKKIIRLEKGRPGLESPALKEWEGQLVEVRGLAGDFQLLREADGAAYLEMVRVRDGRADRRELLAAILKALDIPRLIMDAGEKALELAGRVGRGCRRHLVSDLMVVGELLAAAIQGAYHIARANLPLIRDPQTRCSWEEELGQTAARGDAALSRLKKLLLSRYSDEY